jgi:hypothetical protein
MIGRVGDIGHGGEEHKKYEVEDSLKIYTTLRLSICSSIFSSFVVVFQLRMVMDL